MNRCKKCNSSQVYLRLRNNELVCKQCGYIEKLKEQEVKNESKENKRKCC